MPYVYILESLKTGRYYIGSSKDVNKRLEKHNDGHVLSTRNYRPFREVFRKEYEEIKIDASEVPDIEDRLINEHLGQIKIEGDEKKLTKELMGILTTSKHEGEKVADFEKRIKEEVLKILD